MEIKDLNWRKSSYTSGNGGNCVEIAPLPGGMAVRDSKRPTGPMIRFPESEWRTFVQSLKIAEPTNG
ncbi:DUF397 domain-containing protein [Sphaerisporangium melleum]|uniref:DUF397 domain-containing protein n=1 Tax=Sphaerisporangium melleum TaxID=321316 RepID=UPI0035E785FC